MGYVESAKCQNIVRYLGCLWRIKCHEVLVWRYGLWVCPVCGWTKPTNPPLPLLSLRSISQGFNSHNPPFNGQPRSLIPGKESANR